MICQPTDISPVVESTLTPLTMPLKFSSYVSTGAYVPLGSGTEKRVATRTYVVFGVTNDDPWLPIELGMGPRICFVLKSRRLMRAIRLLALSFTKSQRPSYRPLVLERPGWCTSPQVYSPIISFVSFV